MAEGRALLLALDSLQETLSEQDTLIAATESSLRKLQARKLEIEKRINLISAQMKEFQARNRKAWREAAGKP